MKASRPLLWFALALGPGAQAQDFPACPDEFPVDAVKLSPLPQKWVGIAPGRLPLTSVDLIVGQPQPAAAIGQRRRTRHGYEVVYEATTTEPVEKWLACRYGDLAMAKRLPDGTDRCTVSYTRRPAFNTYDIQVACHVAEVRAK